MPEYVDPVLDKLRAVLAARTPALLAAAGIDPFAAIRGQFSGVVENFPAVFVMPVRTEIDPEASGIVQQAHQLQVKLAITGAEPDLVLAAAVGYVRATALAIEQSFAAGEWHDTFSGNGQVMNVFVRMHDYGPLFEANGVMARFPELDVVVVTVEAEA